MTEGRLVFSTNGTSMYHHGTHPQEHLSLSILPAASVQNAVPTSISCVRKVIHRAAAQINLSFSPRAGESGRLFVVETPVRQSAPTFATTASLVDAVVPETIAAHWSYFRGVKSFSVGVSSGGRAMQYPTN